MLQDFARYKYDEYQQFSPGLRFVESLAFQPHGLPLEGQCVVAGRNDSDLLRIELIKAERRCRPADINLARHYRRQIRGRSAQRGRLGRELVLLHEGGDDAVGR